MKFSTTTPLTRFSEEAAIAAQYKKRTGGGRKSVSGERYDPTQDFDEEPSKIVPKSDEQRKRLQTVANDIMLLNRLDDVSKARVRKWADGRSVSSSYKVLS